MAALTTDQLVALGTSAIVALQTGQIAALTTNEVAALTTTQLVALTTAQIAALSTAQVGLGLSTTQVASLTTSQVASITTANLAALTTDDLAALGTADIAALRTYQVAALTTDQVVSLSTDQIVALTTNDVVALTTKQVVAMTTNEVAALTTTQVQSLTTTQIGALTTDQISALNISDPIVLDLNGKGVLSQSVDNGVQFDVFGTGTKVNTGWVASGDGLLVMDPNHTGNITSGAQLFGSATTLADGSKASNGFQALAALDTNHDGVINAKDAAWSSLGVWVDGNSDGISEPGEVHSLDSLGIVSLTLNPEASDTKDNGNLVSLISSYQTADGKTHEMADVSFVADKQAATSPASTATASPRPSSSVPQATGLQSKMGEMVSAISSFGTGQGTGSNGAAASLPQPVNPNAGGGIANLVSALEHYDANGKPVQQSALSQSVPTSLAQTLGHALDQASKGILTPSK